MITLQKQPISTLDVSTGKLTGMTAKKPPVNIGMDMQEFHRQVIDLANKKIPLQKTLKAVDSHPDITDKSRAKSMATAVYQILGKK